jgi:phage recombination protein Bet
MNNIVKITDRFSSPQVSLIQRMNPDCNYDEFNTFMHVAATLGLDPLKKQIYAFVFSKEDEKRRKMSIVVGIDGFRAVANRSGNYRPDDRAPRFTIDESKINPDSNPLGLISAEVTVYKHVHGSWFPVTVEAYWDEYAPLVVTGDSSDYEWVDTGEFYEDSGKPKRRKQLKAGAEKPRLRLDPNKDTWRKMPRVMLSKCAEAAAIRRGWPEDLSAVYSDEELDRAKTIDLTASEIVQADQVERRLAAIGGANTIMFDMGGGLTRIPLNTAADTIISILRNMPVHEVLQWRSMNTEPLKEFWARAKSDALGVKEFIEKIEKQVEEETK